MIKSTARYNPGIHGDERLITEFVVRMHYLDLVLESLNEKSAVPSRHLIIVGPRGIGKTALVRRVAAEVRVQPALSDRWYPIVFSEEAYEVGTPGEFWLTAVFHLSDQTQDPNLLRAYEDIRVEGDESRLRERALAELMDFADKQGKSLVLIVENLNMILGQQLSGRDGWVLRHTLQNEPRLMLLGTAPLRFEEIEHVNKAWFELVTIYELKPLDDTEIKILWNSLTSEELSNDRLRPIQILTGGNPRLISILASFAVHTSFRELMDNLTQLIDDHTEYFKGQLDGLAPLERKVFVTLLDLWDPSTASEVAAAARMGVSKASSFLGRLCNRGAVSTEESGRKKRYKATERLYNIYYLMRRRGQGHPSDRVHAVVTFMLQFYERDLLITTAKKLAEEACLLEPERRRDHFYAYEDILIHLSEPDRAKMVGATPPEFLNAPDATHIVKRLASIEARRTIPNVNSLIKQGIQLAGKGDLTQAHDYFRRALELDPESYEAWDYLGQCLHDQKQYDEAKEALMKTTSLRPNSAAAWANLGHLLGDHLRQFRQAKEAYTKAIELGVEVGWVWARLGQILKDQIGDYQKAEEAFRKALELEPNKAWTLAELGDLLSTHLRKHEEGEQSLKEAVELDPGETWGWTRLSRSQRRLKRQREAELTLRRAMELNPGSEALLRELGHLLDRSERYAEAEKVFRKIVDSNPKAEWAWGHLGDINKSLGNYEQAESLFKRALELDPSRAWIWTALGDLYERLNRGEDAEQAYTKAVEVDPDDESSLTRLVEYLLVRSSKVDEALRFARQFVSHVKTDYSKLNTLAWLFHEEAPDHCLPEAESWARSAFESAPSELRWRVGHTLAAILGAQGKWKEALELAPIFLDVATNNEDAVGDSTDFIISAAADGNAKAALDVVLHSKGAGALEPLIFGLKLFLGDTEFKAQEIVEIGEDVVRRIREREGKNQKLSSAPHR